ncbi:hypothetical protein BKA82DRAFT_10044 [Pisolithus tinctorius]|uniref:Uncharacterized protein n=1 Tax=Pisolithus tinctorius Marx 270 TaxID=870435 RepID=A0A0C3JUP9_PISTI|nr:hypothetical protein BKA82DRAFT_10044 [Pisolithus tinctorius]KIO01192.1 hypothetical protein M404DRAFT_10044 [Pisolithus tinctorius Marx 270]
MAPTTVKFIENVIILEVENLLQGWPAYVINFTPENPGLHKLILHLKNLKKYVKVDSDDEDEATIAEYHRLIIGMLTSNSDMKIMVTAIQPEEALQSGSPEDTSDKETSNDKEMTCNMMLLTTMLTVPIQLHGTLNQFPPVKHKTFNENWPPCCPCTFCKISPHTLIMMHDTFLTFPAVVRPVLEAISSGSGEEVAKSSGVSKV